MLAYIVEKPTAGNCPDCHLWRWLTYQIDTGKSVCDRCAILLKNTNQLKIVKPVKPAPEKKHTNQAPAIKKKPKPLLPGTNKEKILNLLKSNHKAYRVSEVQELIGICSPTTWKHLNSLMEEGLVVRYEGRQTVYAYHEHADVFNRYENISMGFSRNVKLVEEILEESDKPMAAKDIFAAVDGEITEQCILRNLRFLVADFKAVSAYQEGDRTEYFALIKNEVAASKVKEIADNGTESRIIAFLQNGISYKCAIAASMGKRPGNLKAVNKGLDNLVKQGIIKTHKKGRTNYYELIK